MADLSIQGEVVVNSEKAESAFDRVGDKASQMANEVVTSAGKAGQAVDKIGDGADKGAEKFTRAEARMRDSIKRSTRELEMLGKTASQKFEANLEFKGLDKAKFQPFLNELRQAEEATKRAETGISSMSATAQMAGRAMALAFSGAAITGFLGKVISVQREFDVLNSSLKTVTGSSAAAEREMAWLKDFAKETPFGLAQATQGFVKMKALGLDPTRAALTSFGNTASAMGKDLNQMIEAVADASTGEFERLKEFGIKAKKEGDQVSLTFQGVTKTIGNSAREITQYLEDIGNTSFGGAMEERAKTLDGTIAALGDTWDELFRTVSSNNVGGLIFDSVTLANGALEDATTILRALGGAAQDAGRDTGALSTIQSGIATVFETVAVLGANLKFVLVGIGNEIGGLAAQVAQAAQFNFSGVAAIRRAMVADAEAARKEIDATTARILNARKAQEEYARYATRNASAATDPRRVDSGGSTPRATSAASSGAGRGVKETISEYDKLIKKLSEELPKAAAEAEAAQMGYNKAQTEFLALAGSDVWAKFTDTQRATVAALFENKIVSEQAGEAAKTLAKANLDAAASREKYITSLATGIDKIQADITAQIEATERMGLSKEAIAELDAAKLEMLATDLELQAVKALDRNLDQQTYDALKAQAQAYRELGIAKKGGAAKEAALDLEKANADAAKKAQEDWERAAEDINRSLTDALLRGFESGKDFAKNLRDTLKNMFNTLVLRPIISAVMTPVSGMVNGVVQQGMNAVGLGGVANAANGGGNLLSMGSNAASLAGNWGAVSGYFGGGMSAANAAGSLYANASGTGLNGLLATNGAYGTAAGSSGMGALGATGYGALIAAAAMATDRLYQLGWNRDALKGEGKSNAFNATFGWVHSSTESMLGKLGIGDRWASILSGTPVAAALFGRKLKESGIEGDFGGETGFEGRRFEYYKGGLFRSNKTKYEALDEETRKSLAGTFDAMRIGTKAMAETLGLGTSAIDGFTAHLKVNLKGLSAEEADKRLKEEFDKIADSLASTTLGTQDYTRAGETALQTLTRLSGILTGVNQVFENLGTTLYASSLAGADMASQLVDLFGGMDGLIQTAGSYMQNYYSADEQRAAVQRQLQKAFDGLSLKLPDIDAADARAQFRALAEAQDLTTESGRKAYAALLGLSGAFAGVTQSAEDAASAAKQLADEQERARQDSIRSASDLLKRAIDRDKSALQDQASGMQDVINALSASVSTLKSNARELYGQVDGTAQMLAAQGMVYIEQALGGVRAGGSVADYAGLTDAIGAARGGINTGAYASQFERERDALVLAGQLSELGELGQAQLTFEDRQLKALTAQIDALDALGKRADDLVNGTASLTESVQTYFDRLLALLAPEEKPGASKPGQGGAVFGGTSPGGSFGPAAGADAKYSQVMSGGSSGAVWYQGITGGSMIERLDKLAPIYHSFDGTGDLAGLAAAIKAAGGTVDDLSILSGNFPSDWRKALAGAGIPAFAVGTNRVPRDMLAQIHEGEAIVPKAYNPWAGGQSMGGGNAELLAELRALRAEVAQLRQSADATAGHTAGLPQMVDQFDNVTEGGNAMRVEVMA